MTNTPVDVRRQLTPTRAARLTGDIDYASEAPTREQLRFVLAERQDTVVVDLSEVTSIDCTGLGLLLGANAAVGGRMVLLGCPRSVLEFLHVTGTYDAFATVEHGRPGRLSLRAGAQ